jgi:hypothetical protein
MTKEPYVSNNIKVILDYLDKNPSSFNSLIENVQKLSEGKNVAASVTNVGRNFIGSLVPLSIAKLYAYYGFDKKKLQNGILSNGFLRELVKLDPKKIVTLFDIAEASGVAKIKDREVFIKTCDLFKNFNEAELDKISEHLINYLEKRKLFGRGAKELIEPRLNLIGTIASYLKSPEEMLKFQVIAAEALKENKIGKSDSELILSENSINSIDKISVEIGSAFKYSEQINKLSAAYSEYNLSREIRREFIEASKEMFKDKNMLGKAQLAILQTMNRVAPKKDKIAKRKFYNALKNFIESNSLQIDQINVKLKEDRGAFEIAINDMLKNNSENKIFKKAKNLDLDGKAIFEFLEKISDPKIRNNFTHYLEKPNTVNFIRVFSEGHLIKWASGRAAALCKNSDIAIKAKNAIKGGKETFKEIRKSSYNNFTFKKRSSSKTML